MIKKIDAYIIRYFLFSMLIITFILLGLYLVIDFFTKLTPFMETNQASALALIFKYYIYRFPIYLVDLLPIIILATAMITVSRFIKTNEFIPMLFSGISMRRIISPILTIALIMVVVTFLINEMIIPLLESEISHTDKILRFEGAERYILTQDDSRNSLLIERYDYTHKKMTNINMVNFNQSKAFNSTLSAEYGIWYPEIIPNMSSISVTGPGWVVYNGVEYTYNPVNGARQIKRFGEEGYYLQTSLTPTDLERSEKSLSYMGVYDLSSRILQYPHQVHLKIQLYNKFVIPFSLFILVFAGIPFLLLGESRNLFTGIGICLVVSIAFFVTQFFFINLGNKGILPAPFAVTLPLVIFGTIGLVFMKRVHT
ncbi:MAG: LptF/LptG family permease [Planctomycetes bacterium]|nr:LptF/LptG family permease [Planctomycetota bacterium]